jgi:hypothetical protein
MRNVTVFRGVATLGSVEMRNCYSGEVAVILDMKLSEVRRVRRPAALLVRCGAYRMRKLVVTAENACLKSCRARETK